MTDLVRFVDSIVAAPATRLDLNDGTTWGLNYAGTDMSPPPLKEAWASTLLVDGELQSASAYTNRRLKLALDLMATSVDDAAAKLQALWRELNRPTNVLMWKPEGAANPVFFRTLRSSATQVVDYPGDGRLRTVDVEIVAEPFALGPKEVGAPVTVTNDPAAANGCCLDISGVKGDVETPLILRMADGVMSNFGSTSVFGIRRRGTVSATPYARQLEGLSNGADTTAQADATASAGNCKRCTFALNAAMITRVSGVMTAAGASTDLRGTYRVFLRARHSVAADAISVRLTWGYGTLSVSNPAVPVTTSHTGWQYYDLALMQMPSGPDPVTDGYSGVEVATAPLTVYVDAARISGTGNLDLDCLLFVPADDTLFMAKWPLDTADLEAFVIDGAREMAYGMKTSVPPAQIVTTSAIAIAGGFLAVSPGVTNRIVMLPTVSVSDSISTAIAYTAEYYPRYLYVRPAAS